MRILQLGPYAPPHGGVQANLEAIRVALNKRGIPCAVIIITRSGRTAPAQHIYRPENPFHFIWLLTRLRYDVIHLHIGGTITLRLLALLLLSTLIPRRKSVLTFHSGGYPSSVAGSTAHPWTFRGLVLRRFDRIVAVSEEIAEMLKRFGVEPQRIRIICPHVVTAPIAETNLPDALQAFRDSHEPMLVTVGGLEPEYDLPTQIETLGLVRETHTRAGLVIVGSGSLKQTISDHINSKSYSEDVILCGDVPHAITLRLIAESDLFLRTTLYDGDSISVREALHLGIPVIATSSAARPDGVELVPPSNPIALQEAIERRLVNGASQIPQNEIEENNVEAVLELYMELAQDI